MGVGEFIEQLADNRFGFLIERAGRLVEDEKIGIAQQFARQRQPLPLAAGEQRARPGRAAWREPFSMAETNSCTCARRAASSISASLAAGRPEQQILRHRSVEQLRVLRQIADMGAQRPHDRIHEIVRARRSARARCPARAAHAR
jgi:hypothetical protein